MLFPVVEPFRDVILSMVECLRADDVEYGRFRDTGIDATQGRWSFNTVADHFREEEDNHGEKNTAVF